jgi:3-dehydroquinate synthase
MAGIEYIGMTYNFIFGTYDCTVKITGDPPCLDYIRCDMDCHTPVLLVYDETISFLAERIRGNDKYAAMCPFPHGVYEKNWSSVEKILLAAQKYGMGRDSLFCGIGGGRITDLTAFAASIYMRGVRLVFVSTTLLGMTDAAIGGKNGFDLGGIKNLAGTFYPARFVYMPVNALQTLSQREIASGMAELVKTAVIEGTENALAAFDTIRGAFFDGSLVHENVSMLAELIGNAVLLKGRFNESHIHDTGGEFAYFSFGHTFAHALESSCAPGEVTHGEAVAWGMARACDLGMALGITSEDRVHTIKRVIETFGYETAVPHPLVSDKKCFINALLNDKKKRNGRLIFIVPVENGVRSVAINADDPVLQQFI